MAQTLLYHTTSAGSTPRYDIYFPDGHSHFSGQFLVFNSRFDIASPFGVINLLLGHFPFNSTGLARSNPK